MKNLALALVMMISVSAFANSLERSQKAASVIEQKLQAKLGSFKILSDSINPTVINDDNLFAVNLASILVTIKNDPVLDQIQSKKDLAKILVVAFVGYTQNLSAELTANLSGDANYQRVAKDLCDGSMNSPYIFSAELAAEICR